MCVSFRCSARKAGRRRRKNARRIIKTREQPLEQAIANTAETFDSIESADLSPLLERIGEARVVLLGEASHGTSEFYRMREAISRELILHKGFNFIAIEGDWPDAARIDHYVRHKRIFAVGMDGVRPLPGLDVAQ